MNKIKPDYKPNNREKQGKSNYILQRLLDAIAILFAASAIFLLASLATYYISFQQDLPKLISLNAGGKVGVTVASFLLLHLGYTAYLLPILLMYVVLFLYKEPEEHGIGIWLLRVVGMLIILTSLATSASVFVTYGNLPNTGGSLGAFVSNYLLAEFSVKGTGILLTTAGLVGITLFASFSWSRVIYYIFAIFAYVCKFSISLSVKFVIYLGKATKNVFDFIRAKFRQERKPGCAEYIEAEDEAIAGELPKLENYNLFNKKKQVEKLINDIPVSASVQEQTYTVAKSEVREDELVESIDVINLAEETVDEEDVTPSTNESLSEQEIQQSLPLISLLEKRKASEENIVDREALAALATTVEERLLEFGAKVTVVSVSPGPVITRFELDLSPGLKVSKISGLAKDLARSLSVVSVRVVDVIPGKSYVGLEVPNPVRDKVYLSEILGSVEYSEASSKLSLGLGHDISGKPVIVDLLKMPHLLVAGTTGAGKSVGINAMLLSLLYKAHYTEVKLLLIDPKMLELSIYNDIPHLITPVVTDMKDAANALRWCVNEMERRYKLMADLGVRNIQSYNSRVKEAQDVDEQILDPDTEEELEVLPYIVIIVDELADLMMTVGKKVEELIARIAQKARASGIHLILATQRPSVDVITGLIKSNIPTRISFQVSSKIDSRTILDQSGAEQLLGQGDMLYLQPGMACPTRVHGAFVSDKEVHQVTDDLRKLAKPNYEEDILRFEELFSSMSSDEADDELYTQAVDIVLSSGKASISNVQRRLRIGYNRAARLLEAMEVKGVVSAMDSSGAREILVDKN